MTAQSKNGVDKRKLQIFLIFLVCSFLIWLISKLSETYTERTSYELVFVQVPDSLRLSASSKTSVSARIQTSGFQMLSAGFRGNQVMVDVSQFKRRGDRFYISPVEYRRQMEQQLSGSVRIQEVDRDTLFLELYSLVSRKVPVEANVTLGLAQNFMMKGPVQINPDSVLIMGPENEVSGISSITTVPIEYKELQESFNREVALLVPEAATSVKLDAEKVRLKGEVFRFSEKILQIPVTVLNPPENTDIKIFPNTIEVLCRAELEMLRELEANQITLAVDFRDIREGVKTLPVKLQQKPESVQSVQLMIDEVEYLLIRQ